MDGGREMTEPREVKTLRLTPAEVRRFKAAARKLNMTLGEFLRFAASKECAEIEARGGKK